MRLFFSTSDEVDIYALFIQISARKKIIYKVIWIYFLVQKFEYISIKYQ